MAHFSFFGVADNDVRVTSGEVYRASFDLRNPVNRDPDRCAGMFADRLRQYFGSVFSRHLYVCAVAD